MNELSLHPDTRILLATWRTLNQLGARTPSNDGMASNHAALIQRLFLLEKVGNTILFRMAGEQLRTILGHDPAGEEFATLFSEADQAFVRPLLEQILQSGNPGLLRLRGHDNHFRSILAETLLAPVPDRPSRRLIGLLQPTTSETLLRGRPVTRWAILGLYPPNAQASENGLKVVAGGRQ